MRAVAAERQIEGTRDVAASADRGYVPGLRTQVCGLVPSVDQFVAGRI